MFQNEIDTLEILTDSYQNIISENKLLIEYLNDFIIDSRDLSYSNEKITRSYNIKIQNIIRTLISIQKNTTITNDYGQTTKPFNYLSDAKDYIKINYAQNSNINNLNALKFLPICKLSSFQIKNVINDDINFFEINFNKLDRLKPWEIYQAKVPILRKSDNILELIKFSQESVESIEKINYLIELNIKKIRLGIKQIHQISKIPN